MGNRCGGKKSSPPTNVHEERLRDENQPRRPQRNSNARNAGSPDFGDMDVPDPNFLKQRRMTTRLWADFDHPVSIDDAIKQEQSVEDQVALLRLQAFLRKNQQDLRLGLLAEESENVDGSQFTDRIEKLFNCENEGRRHFHRYSQKRLNWCKQWVTTPFLLEFLEQNWTHQNFSPFMTLGEVENKLRGDLNSIVVRLSSTIPGFITVSCNAPDTNQPIHVRFQVRSDLQIRGEKNANYANFNQFIHHLKNNQERSSEIILENDIPPPQNAREPAKSISDMPTVVKDENASAEPEKRGSFQYAPPNSHVALYARTNDIQGWVKEAEGEPGSSVPAPGAHKEGNPVTGTLSLVPGQADVKSQQDE